MGTPQAPYPVNSRTSKTPGEVVAGGFLVDASLDGLNTENKSLAEYRGKPLIINVWASWCDPCRAEMGSLERLAKRYNGKEFNIIGISTDDYLDKAAAFIDQAALSFENYIDHELLMENMLGATTIPLTVLVDADGRVLMKVRGSREWDSPEILQAIGNVFKVTLL
ncbi:MAG: TlpA family protein disulfide reductase [Gammaproteobacteria bacterium]|nr:TlpA family protein disulfide reductase [Gammaproteobacteria bacterium]